MVIRTVLLGSCSAGFHHTVTLSTDSKSLSQAKIKKSQTKVPFGLELLEFKNSNTGELTAIPAAHRTRFL